MNEDIRAPRVLLIDAETAKSRGYADLLRQP